MSCEQTRELAAELALGIADGQERARALEHLSHCAECRRAVAELTEVTDELLLVASVHEPRAGFESRVLARIEAPRPAARRARRWKRPLLVLAPAGAAA